MGTCIIIFSEWIDYCIMWFKNYVWKKANCFRKKSKFWKKTIFWDKISIFILKLFFKKITLLPNFIFMSRDEIVNPLKKK